MVDPGGVQMFILWQRVDRVKISIVKDHVIDFVEVVGEEEFAVGVLLGYWISFLGRFEGHQGFYTHVDSCRSFIQRIYVLECKMYQLDYWSICGTYVAEDRLFTCICEFALSWLVPYTMRISIRIT